MADKEKTIIVTGGAGFIGSCLVAGLEERGYNNIIVVDSFADAPLKWHNLAHRRHGIRLQPIGRTVDLIKDNAEEIAAVVHLGAISATTATDVDTLVELNTLETCNIVKECVERDIPVLYASSASAYGDGSQGMKEEAAFRSTPLNPYAWSKINADRLIFGDTIDTDRAVVALRFFNVYGPNEYHKGSQSSVVPRFYSQLTREGMINLFSSGRDDVADGEQRRDFVWVDDVVKVIISFVEQGCRPGGIYNVGTGHARSFNDMAQAIGAATGCLPFINYIPMPDNLAEHYQYHTCSEGNRLKSRAKITIDFTPLEAGVDKYITKYLRQPDKYR